MLKVSASLFQTNVLPSTLLETASPVMMDTFSELEDASWLLLKSLPTSDVLLGTGKARNVSNAPTTGSLMLKASAFLYLTNAPLSTLLEIVFPAMMDTDSFQADASWLPNKNPLTLAAPLGTGRAKNA